MDNLIAYYQYIGIIHGLTGLVGKVCLLAVLLAIWTGQAQKTLARVFAFVVGGQLMLAGWVAISFGGEDQIGGQAGPGPLVLGIISVVVAAATLISLLSPQGRWSVRPASGIRAAIGWAIIFWAFYYPVTGTGHFRSLLFSPTTALPHPVLLYLGGVVWMSAPNAHRLVAWAAAGGLVVLGAVDVLLVGFPASWVLVGVGLLIAGDMVKSQLRLENIFVSDEPPVDVEERKEKREFIRRQTKEKTWKLK